MDTFQVLFLQRLLADRPADRPISKVALWACDHFRVGLRAGPRGRRIQYVERDFTAAQQILAAHGHAAERPVSRDRADAALAPGLSEKSGSQAPGHDSVAYKWLGRAVSGDPVQSVPGSYGVATVAALLAASSETDCLLVVENLETFRYIDRYRWLTVLLEERRVLAVFRGDAARSAADAARLLEGHRAPVWAFYDFDPAGLAMAAQLPRLQRLVLPAVSALEKLALQLRRSDLYAASEAQWASTLERLSAQEADSAGVAGAWDLLKSLRRGVPQEAMQDLPA